jgi:ABC-type phosphate/phosphonate transport system permease subunit
MLLYPIWLVLAAVFFAFAFQHWRLSQRDIRPFRLREGEVSGDSGKTLKGFVEDWNRYLENVNGTYRDTHRVAMAGYTVSGALAIVSMFLSLSF